MKIQILPESDARRIAAGEVIENPSSALRELLDNAIDAQSKTIKVLIEEGGVASITIIDDGLGMEKEDLQLCTVVHATSKIRSLEDLNMSYSLGFRGEALASLVACAHLSITTRTRESEHGYLLEADLSQQKPAKPTAAEVGTKVCVEEIFFNLPARKKFLKSTRHEQRECEQVFLEKAMAHPHIQFYFWHDKHLKHHFLSTDILGRAKQIWGSGFGHQPLFLQSEFTQEAQGFSLCIVAASPGHYYHNRRHIHIYVNGRRINDFALVQAVLHSYSSLLPGGQFPAALVFLTIRPDLIDFNIHPAKKDVKIRNHGQIHKEIVRLLSHHLAHYQTHTHTTHEPATHSPLSQAFLQLEVEPIMNKPKMKPQPLGSPIAKEEKTRTTSTLDEENTASWHYIGQVLGVFLIVERDNHLLLLDQHAAHERILFEELRQKPLKGQRLLVPQVLSFTQDQVQFILEHQEELKEYGVEISANDTQPCELLIHALPAQMSTAFWQDLINTPSLDLSREIYANMACKKAIKEGEVLEPETARDLITGAFALSEPFCPHGRPLWIEISRDKLYQWIKRIV